VPPRLGLVVRPLLFLLIVASAYTGVRAKRTELVDFVVPRRAAVRFVARERLYRPEDGHYQYKYLPAFAGLMVPFALVPARVAEFVWFTLTVAMAWTFVSLSVAALPDRRRASAALIGLTLLLTGKFFVKELAFGQFNLLVALFLVGAVIAAQEGRGRAAGAALAAGVFVKPYALVLVPWLAWTQGWRPFVPFGVILLAGLLAPAAVYGWNGNLTLLAEWFRTVTDTTAPNLLSAENISFASMWAKWMGPGAAAASLALASAIVAAGAGAAILLRRRHVREPDYLEGAFFFLLVPLLSPQGWDYVLILALPAYMCLVDRWRDLPPAWRAVAVAGCFLTSFTIFDLLGRALYTRLMQLAGVSVGAVLIASCLVRLRWRAAA
jgi:hypothetical protein